MMLLLCFLTTYCFIIYYRSCIRKIHYRPFIGHECGQSDWDRAFIYLAHKLHKVGKLIIFYPYLIRIRKQSLCICKGKAAYNISPPYLRIAKSLRAMGYEVFKRSLSFFSL